MMAHHSRFLEDLGLQYLDIIAWKKTTANYANPRNIQIKRSGHYLPAIQWEALLVYQKPGALTRMDTQARLYMSEHHTNVWEIPNLTRQLEMLGHPAVCPVEIPLRCLLAYTQPHCVVLDPFGGAGTTMIAAEKTGRRALLAEISPTFCEMAARRWERLTGAEARRVSQRSTRKRRVGNESEQHEARSAC